MLTSLGLQYSYNCYSYKKDVTIGFIGFLSLAPIVFDSSLIQMQKTEARESSACT